MRASSTRTSSASVSSPGSRANAVTSSQLDGSSSRAQPAVPATVTAERERDAATAARRSRPEGAASATENGARERLKQLATTPATIPRSPSPSRASGAPGRTFAPSARAMTRRASPPSITSLPTPAPRA